MLFFRQVSVLQRLVSFSITAATTKEVLRALMAESISALILINKRRLRQLSAESGAFCETSVIQWFPFDHLVVAK